jgi:hypothetical protein
LLGAARYCTTSDISMVPDTTGHCFASDACRRMANANSAMTQPKTPSTTTIGDSLGLASRVETNSVSRLRPISEPKMIASAVAIPIPRQPHQPFGVSRSSTASRGCSGL